MLLNDKYNLLFIHIQKTAGTSIINNLFQLGGTRWIGNQHSLIKYYELENKDKYFKFCFVRNPWDRLLSWYNMLQRRTFENDWTNYVLNNSTNFSEFLALTDIVYETCEREKIFKEDYPKSITINQLDYISDNEGNIVVDFIGMFENLQNDYAHIMKQLNIPAPPLQHLNKFEHKDYRSYYSDADIEKVYNLYKRDIEYFHYQF
jgi:chondroitin 4-sulfotransferase 11